MSAIPKWVRFYSELHLYPFGYGKEFSEDVILHQKSKQQ